jgi:hypothetical protein
VESQLKTVKRVSWILSISLTLFLIVIWPAIMVNFGDYSAEAFKFWIIIAQIFVFIAFVYSLLSPFVETLILRVVGGVIKERREKAALLEEQMNEQKKLAKARGKKKSATAVVHADTEETMAQNEPQYDD